MKKSKMIFSAVLFSTSLLTMVATTFAWVGIASNSTFEEFTLSLKTDNESGDYGVQLSLTGLPNSFSDSIDGISIKKQILKNMGYGSTIDNASDEYINYTYSTQYLDQCTPQKSIYYPDLFSTNDLQYFENVTTGNSTKKYIWFDIYATMYAAKVTASEDIPLSLFLRESILSSDDIGKTGLLNDYTYPSIPITVGEYTFPSSFLNKKFSGNVMVNPASAARVCVQTFEPIDLYTIANTNFVDYKIYQYDDYMPSYDSSKSIYSFGGILPEEYNMAYQQYNMMYSDNQLENIPDWQLNRGDITYKDEGYTGCICYNGSDGHRNDNLTIGKMIKFRVYFWFEGWDSDCFEIINKKSVNVNLSFSNKAPFDV